MTTTPGMAACELAAGVPPTATPPARNRRWLGAGFAVCAVGWGANQFTPLLLLYRARLGLSPAVVEATFGMYAIGLIPGLLVVGPLSDRLGRRRTVLAALGLSIIAGLVFIIGARHIGWLFVGRLIMGMASGSAFSSGTAWIKELSAPPHDVAPSGAGARRAGGAMTLGFALGPLFAGVLAQWAPLPTTLPYLPQLALAVGALSLASRVPETVPSADPTEQGSLWRRLRIRGLDQPRFLWVVLPLAPWVFGGVSIAMVYVPGLVYDRVPGVAMVFAAVVALCTALSGVLVAPLARRLEHGERPSRPRLLVVGLTVMILGLLLEAGISALVGSVAWLLALVLLAGVGIGCGYGFCLVFGLAEVQRLARPGDLAGMTAVFQAFTYVGFAAPYLLSMSRSAASPATLLLCVAALAVITLVFTVWQAHRTAES